MAIFSEVKSDSRGLAGVASRLIQSQLNHESASKLRLGKEQIYLTNHLISYLNVNDRVKVKVVSVMEISNTGFTGFFHSLANMRA